MTNETIHHTTAVKSPWPWPFQTIAQAAQYRAQHTPGKIALYHESSDNKEIVGATYFQIWQESQALASKLAQMGLSKGDVISIQLPNWYEAVLINLAASCIGAVVNPIVPIYRGKELKYMLQKAASKVFFVPEVFRNFDYPALAAELHAELPDLEHVIVVRGSLDHDIHFSNLVAEQANFEPISSDPDALKLLLFTSGTTGLPKGVMHSHRSIAWAIQNCCDYWSMTEGDLMFMPSPVTHITGYTFGLELPFFNGTPSALMEIWRVDRAAQYINQVQATVSVGATPFLQELTQYANQENDPLASLRLFACGGAVVPPDVIYRANEALQSCLAVRVYGSSETPIVTLGFTLPEQIEHAAHTDGAIFRYQVRIVDDEGNVLGQGEEGEILAKGPAMMLGYQETSDQANACDQDGYFKTGDLGYIDQENALVISGRKKDLIIRGGENISAREIEDVLICMPEVNEVAIVAAPHARLGESVCAYIVATAGSELSLANLTQACKAADLSKQKWPESYVLVDEIPKTASGKVQKFLLKQKLQTQQAE
jgi:acyl-CoA synthetase (AMP-forming)/AMP-acid ligase II